MLKRVRLVNFKSFAELDVELGPLTVVVGPNASGKSNFLQVFEFLRDLADHGLENAISMQGGAEYFVNKQLCPDEPFSITVDLDMGSSLPRRLQGGQATYELAVRFSRASRPEFEVVKDVLTLAGTGPEGDWSVVLSKTGERVEEKTNPSNLKGMFPVFGNLPESVVLLEAPYYTFFGVNLSRTRVGYYDFDPRVSKKAVTVRGRADLDETGGNLPIVLNA